MRKRSLIFAASTVAAVAAAVAGAIATWGLDRMPILNTASVRIHQLNADSPDYVILENTTKKQRDISGFALVDDDKHFRMPEGTIIQAGESLRIWCLREGDHAPQGAASGDLVTSAFRIKVGDRIRFEDAGGRRVDQKVARASLHAPNWTGPFLLLSVVVLVSIGAIALGWRPRITLERWQPAHP